MQFDDHVHFFEGGITRGVEQFRLGSLDIDDHKSFSILITAEILAAEFAADLHAIAYAAERGHGGSSAA